MIKWVAVFGNVGIIGWVAYFWATKGVPDLDDDAFWVPMAFGSAAAVNLWNIYGTRSIDGDENIFSLWLKVKKSELRKRLD